MLEAFVLGFWMIWSADRDIYALSESLGFMIIAVIIRGFMSMTLPAMDGIWVAEIGVQWIYVALVLTAVNRLSNSFASTLAISVIGSLGFYWLSQPEHMKSILSPFVS
ncbi:diguanylate cyclase [Neisseria sp. 23W00296]|uniref:hypothetical protein n=1 Tax=unclassified Neisseria TaxID=2623750 RepID=UPI0002A3BA4F|nr:MULTISPECIES: hypothetical protein [unclassified Neisseria]ASP16468.1 diguanylate cyclase [Neisseria sp. KEM232]EKY06172.1 hypothetical protein HMPREF9120_01558 [Neisseria sp. oral taxon 020 str. F0370]